MLDRLSSFEPEASRCVLLMNAASWRVKQPQNKPLSNWTIIFFCCCPPTVRRAHEYPLLTSGLPGPPGSSLLDRSGFHHKTEAEPNDPADVREEAAAKAEPAPAGQLQDDTAAAALLHVGSPPVVWPHIQHSADPHRGVPARTLHDAVRRQTENTLARATGFLHFWDNTQHEFDRFQLCLFCKKYVKISIEWTHAEYEDKCNMLLI